MSLCTSSWQPVLGAVGRGGAGGTKALLPLSAREGLVGVPATHVGWCSLPGSLSTGTAHTGKGFELM